MNIRNNADFLISVPNIKPTELVPQLSYPNSNSDNITNGNFSFGILLNFWDNVRILGHSMVP